MNCTKLVLSFILIFLMSGCGGGSSNSNSTGDTEIELGNEALYSFEESGATAYNSNFDAMHGTISGAVRVDGKVGKALSFENNSPSYVELKILQNNIHDQLIIDFPDNQISIEGWYKFSVLDVEKEYYVFGSRNIGLNPFDVVISNGNFKFTLIYEGNTSNPIDIIESDYEFVEGVWYYVSITYDGEIARLYIDGVENASNSIIKPVSRAFNHLYLGGIRSIGNTDSFPGAIDEFSLYRGVRTQIEILEYLDTLPN